MFRNLLKSKVLLGSSLILTSLIGCEIYYNHIEKIDEENAIKNKSSREIRQSTMSSGSTLDFFLDAVETGDVLIYEKKWHQQRKPSQILNILYQKLLLNFNSSNNSTSAVISNDPSLYTSLFSSYGFIYVDNLNEPWVIELSSFYNKVKVLPLAYILTNNNKENIFLYPLIPREKKYDIKLIKNQFNQLTNNIEDSTSSSSTSSITSSSNNTIINKLDKSSSINFLISLLNLLNYKFNTTIPKDLNDFITNQWSLSNQNQLTNNDKQEYYYNPSSIVMINRKL